MTTTTTTATAAVGFASNRDYVSCRARTTLFLSAYRPRRIATMMDCPSRLHTVHHARRHVGTKTIITAHIHCNNNIYYICRIWYYNALCTRGNPPTSAACSERDRWIRMGTPIHADPLRIPAKYSVTCISSQSSSSSSSPSHRVFHKIVIVFVIGVI